MADDEAKIAVVGVGYWGRNLVRNFYSTGRSVVKFACDLANEN